MLTNDDPAPDRSRPHVGVEEVVRLNEQGSSTSSGATAPTADHRAIDALPDPVVSDICGVVWAALDVRPDLGVVICDAHARMVGGNARLESPGRPLVAGLPAVRWPEHYDLRAGPHGPRLRADEIPIVRALAADGTLDATMYQGLGDDDGELVGRAVALRDDAGRGHGAVGIFQRDPLGAAPRPRSHGHRPTDRATLHLLLEVLRFLPEPCAHPEPLVADVDALLHRRHREALRLADVAAEIGYSPAHLTTRVRELTGATVMQRLETVRLARATRLLEGTTFSVSEIAARTGPWDPSTFARTFRRRHGCSPSAWRSRHGTSATDA